MFARSLRAAFAALILAASFSANAGVGVLSVQITPSADTVLYSRFPAGDADPGPGDTCDVPSGWACLSLGSGSGSISQVTSTSWNFDVTGLTSTQDQRMAYKDAGTASTDEVQLIAQFNGPWSGSTEPLAGFGIGLREGTANTDFFLQCLAPVADISTITSNWGTTSADVQKVFGAPGQSLPRYGAVTYDPVSHLAKCFESGDGSSFVEVNSVDHTFSDVKVSVFGQSRSATASIQGNIAAIALTTGASAITVYDNTPPPPPDPGNHAPVMGDIPNQSGSENIAFSLNVASYCTDADSDPLTFTATGLSGRGLSMSTAGLITGTPNSSAVSASPFSVVVTCKDDELAEDSDAFSMTVAASPGGGDDFPIATGDAAIFDCVTEGAGPGDTLTLAAGTHPSRTFRRCNGTAAAPITIRNDTSGGGPAIIRGSGQSFIMQLEDDSNIVIDGTGKWSGAGSDDCGMTASYWATSPPAPPASPQCGIKVTRLSGAANTPTKYITFKGSTTKVTMKGIEIDGVDWSQAAGSGIGISCNDKQYLAGAPGAIAWRENILIENNYIHETQASGSYCGPNGDEGEVPLRNIEQRYNYVTDVGRRGITTKYSIAGNNSIHHNWVDTTGLEGTIDGFGACYSFHDGFGDFYNNYAAHCGEVGFRNWNLHALESQGGGSCAIYNNIIHDTGERGPGGGHGINVGRNQNDRMRCDPLTIENNTIVDAGANAVNVSSSVVAESAVTVRNNIFAGSTANSRAVAPTSVGTGNTSGTVDFMDFVDDNPSGGVDYHLTVGSIACNKGGTTGPGSDFDGDARPLDSANEDGADEAAVCP